MNWIAFKAMCYNIIHTCALKACPNMIPNFLAYCSDFPVSVAYKTVAFIRLDNALPNSFEVNLTARAICLKWNFLLGFLPAAVLLPLSQRRFFCQRWVFQAGSWENTRKLTTNFIKDLSFSLRPNYLSGLSLRKRESIR